MIARNREALLEAQRRLTSSCVREEGRPIFRPIASQEEAEMAAAKAGFCHFIREKDPHRADARWDRHPDRAKRERITEFRVMLTAFLAAGGRI